MGRLRERIDKGVGCIIGYLTFLAFSSSSLSCCPGPSPCPCVGLFKWPPPPAPWWGWLPTPTPSPCPGSGGRPSTEPSLREVLLLLLPGREGRTE